MLSRKSKRRTNWENNIQHCRCKQQNRNESSNFRLINSHRIYTEEKFCYTFMRYELLIVIFCRFTVEWTKSISWNSRQLVLPRHLKSKHEKENKKNSTWETTSDDSIVLFVLSNCIAKQNIFFRRCQTLQVINSFDEIASGDHPLAACQFSTENTHLSCLTWKKLVH